MPPTRPSKKPPGPKQVDALKHQDKRINIPTEELRDFVRSDEEAPKKVLYQRDPSLDPQLVWKGKDEQDSRDLEVPVVPIYIQEKIHPQALIENLRDTAPAGEPEPELTLFADFNGVRDFRQKIDFYSHDLGSQPKWSNRMILGDSLLVMQSLAEKEGLKGQVQMIYIDPPYGIKFGSNWQVSTRKRDVKDGKVEDATRQPEQVKAFRDTWELGIHSYLSYMRDRLVVARELLTESGSVFVQIGDENVHLVRCLLDEVFGSENFVGQIAVKKTGGLIQDVMPTTVDYLVWFARSRNELKARILYLDKGAGEQTGYQHLELPDGTRRRMTPQERENQFPTAPGAVVFSPTSLESENPTFSFDFQGRSYAQRWKTTTIGLRRLGRSNRLFEAGRTIRYVRRLIDFPVLPVTNNWSDTGAGSFLDPQVYVVQTVTKVVARAVLMTTDPGDLVLDPTCGSGTTAYVAEQWGRRWITIDTSRVALALARTRLMTAKYPYYLLTDTQEGRQKEAEITGTTAPLEATSKPSADVKKGFVYKRVPHVTLKSIANNEEIDSIYERYLEKLEPIRSVLNGVLRKSWEEWEIPREAGPAWPAEARKAHEDWWALRRARQKEIDDSIARRADVEFLFDQPYEDAKRLRVTGPFTVESLSPHRVLAAEDERPLSEIEAEKGDGAGRYETIILDNLRRAGVQNTKRGERLQFDRLETFPGRWIQAVGAYTDAAGKQRGVAISLGPEHGTVGPVQIQEAAKEAIKGLHNDLLLVLGFAFDAHAIDTAQAISPADLKVKEGFVAEYEEQMGKLPVLLVRMNPDLAMGGDLLKKTGSGNLFMVFGEPDLEIAATDDAKITLEIRGLDVYDPTTGVIRSSTTDDIACWFLDTEYNGESFFVRHAYFTGADDPYDKLKRALRAEIDEAAWQSLYTTKSRPFEVPKSGKIAVKVINHYGDEVLKVYDLRVSVVR
jgi:adenine-specific DNA-methyltransferase